MEYFGRLGLVFRKTKERGISAESKETRCAGEPVGDRSYNRKALDTVNLINESSSLTAHTQSHGQGRVEFRSTSSLQVKGDMKSTPTLSTTAHYFPRQDVVFVDVEYLEYEQQVQARARALGSGGWKTWLFWKRHPRPAAGMISAASTPLHHRVPFRTPVLHRHAATPGRHARRGCATVGPLYTNESPSSMQHFSHGAWKDDCNMSPYVALSDRRQRVMSPGPLYLV